jgi:hypothetical protein
MIFWMIFCSVRAEVFKGDGDEFGVDVFEESRGET